MWWLLLLVLSGPCLPLGVDPSVLESPVGARHAGALKTEDGRPAWITAIQYHTERGSTLIGYWVGDRLVAVDVDPEGLTPLWEDTAQYVRPGVLRAVPPTTCRWEQTRSSG